MSSSFSQPKYQLNSLSNTPDTKDSNYKPITTSSNTSINNINNAICNLIDIINDNNLNIFYPEQSIQASSLINNPPQGKYPTAICTSSNNFKHNIDQLNLKFYLETEKILSNSANSISIQNENNNKLFLILFKQINLYIKEIERLNTLIIEQGKDSNSLFKKMGIITKQKEEFERKELMIQALKSSVTSLEKKLGEVILRENKWKEENEKMKKELEIYRKRGDSDDGVRKSKRTLSDVNSSVNYNSSNTKGSNSKLKIIKAIKSTKMLSDDNNVNKRDIINSYVEKSNKQDKQAYTDYRTGNKDIIDNISDWNEMENLLIDIKEYFKEKGNNIHAGNTTITNGSMKHKSTIYTNWMNISYSKHKKDRDLKGDNNNNIVSINLDNGKQGD